MGTRADFYVGKGRDAEWIGSIAWDGYPDGIAPQILNCTSPEAFRHAVKEFFGSRDDVTLPEQGWPWPWSNSGTTDFSYWHYEGKTWGSCFGAGVFPCDQPYPDEDDSFGERPDMPDMSSRKNVAFGKRSGVILIGG